MRAMLASGTQEMCRVVAFKEIAFFLLPTGATGSASGPIRLELLDAHEKVLDAVTLDVGKLGESEEHRDHIYEVIRHRGDMLADVIVAEGQALPLGDAGRADLVRKLAEVRELFRAQLAELRPSTRDRLTTEMEDNFARIEADVRRRLSVHDGR